MKDYKNRSFTFITGHIDPSIRLFAILVKRVYNVPITRIDEGVMFYGRAV
jgi:hypothetical protein